MADITAFPTIRNVLIDGENIVTYTAGAAIKAGQVLAFHGTGVSRTVHPCVAATTMPVGVAIYDVESGDECAVAGRGCRAYVANADDGDTIDAGDPLQLNDNAVGGTVNTAAIVDAGVVAVTKYIIGYAIDDQAGSEVGGCDICPSIITSANNA